MFNQRCLSFISYEITLCLWNFIIGSFDLLLIDLHDIMTCEICSFLIQSLGVFYEK
jgi:hypothetical protein